MENSWPTLVKNPSGNKPMDKFAVIIQNIHKIVFSHTLKNVEWQNATLAKKSIEEEILELREQPGKDILVGSPSLIVAALNLNLVDELQICVQPIILGKGLSLLKNIHNRIDLKLLKTKSFGCGAVIFYYEPIRNPPSKA